MASIRLRDGRWQARVKRQGFAESTRSFSSKQEAERWARALEVQMDAECGGGGERAEKHTVSDLITRYVAEVLPGTKSEHDDRVRLRALAKRPFASTPVAKLTPARVAKFRDERLAQVAAGTVIRELAYLSSIINHARKEWGLWMVNPVGLVRRPPTPKGRDRTLSDRERTALLSALAPIGRRNPLTILVVQLALETAMRRGELLALRWCDLDLEMRTAVLHDTKNGDARTVPLSTKAVEALLAVPRSDDPRVFPITACALAANFDRAVERAGLPQFRFHDLRHCAITRLATKLPNVIELAAVSGHKSLKMLQRYYHPKAADLARKLD